MRKKIFTLLAAVCGLVYVNAADQTVSHNLGYDGLVSAIKAANGSGTVRVEVGTYFASEDELEIPAGVTVIGGYSGGWDDKLNRIYPGAAADISEMTVLDGNSLVNTKPKQKHRVATVYGTLEGCLIRNGHARDDNGGGVYVDGGTVQNCIIKGNVAMSVTDNNALGGGAYLTNEGKLINCVVAYNMANNGYGIAGTGQVINNTIVANTYAPVAVPVEGGNYKHYKHHTNASALPWDLGQTPIYDPQSITISDFSIAQTETTNSQYAVFAAAMDLTTSGQDVLFSNTDIVLSNLTDPFKQAVLGTYLGFTSSNKDFLFKESARSGYGLTLIDNDYIFYEEHANDPMTYVTWYGALAYSLWLGGTLPSEGQWEYAARNNGTDTLDEYMYAGSDVLNDMAWTNDNINKAAEVATKSPNGINLYDMSGNVWEWCADWYGVSGNAYPDYGASPVDPVYNVPGSYRTCRGGSWAYASGSLSLAYRFTRGAMDMYNNFGFRSVLVP